MALQLLSTFGRLLTHPQYAARCWLISKSKRGSGSACVCAPVAICNAPGPGGGAGGGRGAGRGALIGGGTGLVFGAIGENQNYEYIYETAYDDCIEEHSARYDTRNQGYQAQQPSQQTSYQGGSPEPWSDEWFDYCSAKYRSFDPDTGYYLAYSGNYRFCQ